MIFKEAALPGVYIIEKERIEDERGFFTRSFCDHEFEDHGLPGHWVQCSNAYNKVKGTLRGMHMQIKPHEEPKLVECISGAVYDVIVDMRPDSPAYLQHMGMVLSDEDRPILYVPAGFAHGYITLTDHCELFYRMGEYYHPESAVGIRWNDPLLNIKWPCEISVISDKDTSYPDYDPGAQACAS
jgi:dTDP-4-dehydrorhamnose 3,5-epimerase